MSRNGRLEWTARNRAPRDTTARAGEAVAQAVRAASRTDGAVLALLSDGLGAVVDEEFVRHCRALAVRSGRLIVGVDAPSMVSMMKTRWRKPLLEAIRALAPRSRVSDISFEFGTGGVLFERRPRREPVDRTSSGGVEADTIHD